MEEFNETEHMCPPLPEDDTPIIRNGTWECWNITFPNSTDIFICCSDVRSMQNAHNLGKIYFYLSVISAGLLLLTLIVLTRFKSVQNTRIKIHKNLIASFILRFTMKSCLFGLYVFDRYIFPSWLCNVFFSIYEFAYIANFSWMFVEGLHLHFILVMRPFRRENSPCLLFYFIGWVVPGLIMICWVIVMQVNQPDICWFSASGTEKLLIYAPIMFVLMVNLVILLNLIRIVISKLCNENVTECRKVWQTVKSTIVLGFLLGTINLILVPPRSIVPLYIAMFLPYTQSIFVALYCMTNIEVRKAIKRWWTRYRDSRSMSTSGYRGRFSRTSVTIVVTNHINTIELDEGNTTELLAMQNKEGLNGVNSEINGS